MGYRAWFTRVDDLDGFKVAVRNNPNAYGIYYTVEIPADIKVFRNGLWVAWAGDGDGSLTRDMPSKYIPDTLFLDDDVLPVYPDWRADPGRFGRCDFRSYSGGLSLAEADGSGESVEDWFGRAEQEGGRHHG